MNTERLIRLAEHLEHGNLGHDKFNFSCFNYIEDLEADQTGCGYCGCAIGELPILYPNEWAFYGNRVFLKISKTGGSSLLDAVEWFAIPYSHIRMLFISHVEREFNPKMLSWDASREEVAKGIREYITWRMEPK